MDQLKLQERAETVTTAHLADGCIRAHVPLRCAPAGMRPVGLASQLAGRVRPARHVGSVDMFLEAIERAAPGDVLVVDNGGRIDESCVGDLVALEALQSGLAGIVIWGLHRDTVDIQAIGLPVFSMGSIPAGPQRLDPRPPDALASAAVGRWTVDRDDIVVGDEDGVLFVPDDRADEVFTHAEAIRDTERRQADLIRAGTSLREQLHFDRYLAEREKTPKFSFRAHLRKIGGAVEE